MRAQWFGRIVNVSSMGGRLTFTGAGVYHASKHAVEALSDALRFEVAGFGIDAVVVEPGLIHTRFAETAAGSIGADTDAYAGFQGGVAAATPARTRARSAASAAGRRRSRRRSPAPSPRGGRGRAIR
jgi:NAD(P)-dependent dehydrogenase (short-subunit alcohol dehydrogenase family)